MVINTRRPINVTVLFIAFVTLVLVSALVAGFFSLVLFLL